MVIRTRFQAIVVLERLKPAIQGSRAMALMDVIDWLRKQPGPNTEGLMKAENPQKSVTENTHVTEKKRGRPPTENKLSPAEKQRRYRERVAAGKAIVDQ